MATDVINADTEQVSEAAPILIDLGRKSRKKVKLLRKGKGKLFDEVQGAVDELQEAGQVDSSAQVIFVVVEKEPKSLMEQMMIR